MTGKYVLKCVECGDEFEDRYTLDCPVPGCTSLVRTHYRKRRLDLLPVPGIFRYADWLPVERPPAIDAGSISYRSETFSREIGLSDLVVVFSGYWPERGGTICTGSFKELEALPTAVRLREKGAGTLLVSSAGNTGRAFCQISALTGLPVIVVVPETSLSRIWTTEQSENVCLIAVRGDYTDAIEFGAGVCSLPGIIPEGGARNVARRDGMGTVMLDGTIARKRLPDYYFQAVGSGTGGIAAWEAAERLIADGRFGAACPELHLAQNIPFIPMVRAWQEGRSIILPDDMPNAKAAVAAVYSDVLTNRNPPYAVRGGVYDALVSSKGRMYAVTNNEARDAERLFTGCEGIDLDPAASVAVASLVQAVDAGIIDPDGTVLLNITGGGYERIREDHTLFGIEPFLRVDAGTPVDAVRDKVMGWVSAHA
jgi:cysteate synthase